VQEKDWQKAIDAARLLEKDTSKPLNADIAHFHCELALLEAAKGNPDAAAAHLQQALATNRQSVRANLMAGDLDAAAGRQEAAIADWRLVETQSAAHMALVVDRVLGSYRQLGRLADGVQWLRALYARQPSQDVNALHSGVSETKVQRQPASWRARSCGATPPCARWIVCSKPSSSTLTPVNASCCRWKKAWWRRTASA
jgi:lipopolysaccharide biosynthesis regulator YciM